MHKYCMTTPFSYHLYHIPTQKHYYGIKFSKGCSPSMLWTTYFSSSIKVKELIEIYGLDSFNANVRKIFDSGTAALLWEHRVLTKLNAASRSDWLNRHNGSNKFRSPEFHSEATKKAIQAKMTGKKRSDITKAKQSAAAKIRESQRRADGWVMPRESMTQAIATRKERISAGLINPYSKEQSRKISESRTGSKRHNLPDGSFIWVKPQDDQ